MGCSSISAAAIVLSAIAISLQVSPCGAFASFSDSLRVHSSCHHLSLRMSAAASSSEWLYDIPNASWTSAEWNWGYASGTGHDCAAICRRKFATRSSRAEFVGSLLDPSTSTQPPSFEEVKLVLGLAVQRGRWDGSDGGPGGYGDVLANLASARRYETDGTEEDRMVNFVEDMRHRFGLLNPSEEDAEMMKSLDGCNGNATIDELDAARRMCSGLVLKNMGFIDNGL